jgi:hypothetical protein
VPGEHAPHGEAEAEQGGGAEGGHEDGRDGRLVDAVHRGYCLTGVGAM